VIVLERVLSRCLSTVVASDSMDARYEAGLDEVAGIDPYAQDSAMWSSRAKHSRLLRS
jgi:hypothetical protein